MGEEEVEEVIQLPLVGVGEVVVVPQVHKKLGWKVVLLVGYTMQDWLELAV